jgi:cytochrome c biogenesis factor
VLRWSATDRGKILSGLMPSALLALALTAAAYLRGVHDPGHLILAAIAGMAFGVNAVTAVRLFRRGWSYGAGYLGHLGIAIMVLGMVFSAALSRSERVRLVQGTPTRALDMTLTYSGMDPGPKGARFLNIKVQGSSWSVDARPALLPAPRGEGVMRKPAVNGRHDLYVSPVDIESTPEGESGAVWLKRGEELTLGGVVYKFIGFRMTSHDNMQVYADLEATQNGKTIMLSPGIKVSPAGREPIDVESPGGGVISLSRIDADGHRAEVALPGALQLAPPAIVEVSSKPFINLVWIGAVITLLGTGLAGARRAAEKARGSHEASA